MFYNPMNKKSRAPLQMTGVYARNDGVFIPAITRGPLSQPLFVFVSGLLRRLRLLAMTGVLTRNDGRLLKHFRYDA